jgi:hypothetical protein
LGWHTLHKVVSFRLASTRSFQIAPPSSVGKSIATALLVVEYALLLTKETTKSLNRAAPLSKLILTQFR